MKERNFRENDAKKGGRSTYFKVVEAKKPIDSFAQFTHCLMRLVKDSCTHYFRAHPLLLSVFKLFVELNGKSAMTTDCYCFTSYR